MFYFSHRSVLRWVGQSSLLILQLHYVKYTASKVAIEGEERNGGAPPGVNCFSPCTQSIRTNPIANLTAREAGNVGKDMEYLVSTISLPRKSVFICISLVCVCVFIYIIFICSHFLYPFPDPRLELLLPLSLP